MEVNPGRMRQQPSAGGGGRPGFGTNALPPRWDDRKKIDCSFLHAARQLAPLPSSRNRERRLFYTLGARHTWLNRVGSNDTGYFMPLTPQDTSIKHSTAQHSTARQRPSHTRHVTRCHPLVSASANHNRNRREDR